MSANLIKIRANESAAGGYRISKAAHEATLEAGEIVKRAQQEANAVREQAEKEKELLLAESRERGWAAGLEEWSQALAEAHAARAHYLTGNEAHLLRLAIAVARKVVGQSAAIDQEAVLHCVRESIRSIRNDGKLKIRVRAEDEAAVRNHAGKLKAAHPELGELMIVADEGIAMGGCILESELGNIDARFETQLATLERALLRGTDAGGH